MDVSFFQNLFLTLLTNPRQSTALVDLRLTRCNFHIIVHPLRPFDRGLHVVDVRTTRDDRATYLHVRGRQDCQVDWTIQEKSHGYHVLSNLGSLWLLPWIDQTLGYVHPQDRKSRAMTRHDDF